jgi:hypothetical protein
MKRYIKNPCKTCLGVGIEHRRGCSVACSDCGGNGQYEGSRTAYQDHLEEDGMTYDEMRDMELPIEENRQIET